MKEYLMTLTGVMIFSGIVGILSSEGNLKKYVRLLCALCILCAIVSPLFSLLSHGDFDPSGLWDKIEEEDRENYDEIYQNSLLQNGENYMKKTLEIKISEQFSLDPETFDVRIKIVAKNDNYEFESVGIVLREEAIFVDPKLVADYVNKVANCPCTIVYE